MEPDRVGQKLGNYLLLDILGTGGFATVYLGEHIYLRSQAAIKVLKALPQTDKAPDNFLKEARTIARLTHPHIIRVIECGVDVGASNSIPYIVMSYASEGNVRKEYPQGTVLPLEVILSFAHQAAEALQYAHDQAIVHCDVKPENMLIGGPDQILLADFGIANISHTVDVNKEQVNIHSGPIVSGDIRGTVTYMAPERFGGLIRRASDQYSLAVVVYEWLVGDPPFTGSRDEVIYQHKNTPPPTLSTRNPQVTPEIEQVVLKALEKQPDQRYATIKEFATALEQAILASPSYPSTPQTSTPTVIKAKEVPLALEPTVLPEETPIALPTVASNPDPLPTKAVSPLAETQKEPTIASSFSTEAEQSASPASIVSQSDNAETLLPDDQISPPVQPLPDPSTGKAEVPINVQSPVSSSSSMSKQATAPSLFTSASSPTPQQALSPTTPVPMSPSASGRTSTRNPHIAPDPQQQWHNATGYSPRGTWAAGNSGASRQMHMTGGMSLVEQEEESIGFFAYLIAVLGNIVALDGDFANLKEFRNFRRLGWLANGLCAVFCGWLAQSWTVFLVGILVFFSFWLCIRLVKPFMAIAVGLAIAAYWGWFGFFLTKWLLTYPLFSTLPPLQIMVGIFFTISAIIHITYIVRRLES